MYIVPISETNDCIDVAITRLYRTVTIAYIHNNTIIIHNINNKYEYFMQNNYVLKTISNISYYTIHDTSSCKNYGIFNYFYMEGARNVYRLLITVYVRYQERHL